ncbi:MAG: hypothetical protein HN535_05160 [Flavobacteriales bacterium]|nr:hypothetical protein [Flavobacteriales bacterium]
MKHFILTTLLFITILSSSLNAQQISSTAYNKAVIHEDFNQEGDFFPIITTTDNYFILDKGDYLLSRNNEDSEYAIIANNSSTSDFTLKTAVRIGPSNNKKSSIGIILKAQQDGKGAIIFEINKKGEYRIKQLLGNTYKTLTGLSKHEGWVKNKIINGVDEHNFIELRTENNIYDVYINSDYLTTFFVPDYTSGACGLIISPETKARISYYYLNTKGENNAVASYVNENTPSINASIEELNKKIATLEQNNATLNSLNNEARANQEEQISSLNKKSTDAEAITIEHEKEIASLNRIIIDLKNKANKAEDLANTIAENESLITKLTNEKSALTTDINSLNSKSNDLNTKNAELAAVTIEQEKEINNLQNSAASTQSSVATLETTNKELTSKVTSLTSKNSELASVTIEQEKEINALSTTINSLNNNKTDAVASNKQLTKKVEDLKQQIALEKSVNTELTNDLNKTNNSSNSKISKLTSEVQLLKTKANKLAKENTILTTDLSAEKSAHSKTKNGLSKSITAKLAEIKALEAQLNTNNQQIKSAKKNGALANECAKNAASLSAELKKANKEVTALQNIKNKHDDVVNGLNSELSLLKAKQIELTTEVQTLNKEFKKLETTNTELKELFILKDFEVNGVKPSDLTKQTTTYTTPKEIKGNSKIYAVQFGVYMQVQPSSALKGLDEIWYETTEHGTYVYLSGQFKSPQEATTHRNQVAAKGYPNAFVVTLTK